MITDKQYMADVVSMSDSYARLQDNYMARVKHIAKLETEKAALKDALVIVRDALLETTARCGAGYDWNADPDRITLKQGDAFAKASDAFALDIYV